MLYFLTTVFLLPLLLIPLLLIPLLLIQGLYVKLTMRKLPEPEGIRSDISGVGTNISFLIIGDSAAAGVGVKHQESALSGRVIAALNNSYKVSWKLIAQTGDTSEQTLHNLKTEVEENFDFVILSVGVNDVTTLTTNKAWVENINGIVELLKSNFKAKHIILTHLPPMHLFPGLPQPLRWWLGKRAAKLNSLMDKLVENDATCVILSINFPFEASYMAEDGFHPNQSAYILWGNAIAKLIRKSLEK